MTEITSKTPRLAELQATSNDNVFQAVLRCEVGSTNNNSLIGITLGSQARPRVVWHPVTLAFLDAYGYTYDPVTMDVPGDQLWEDHLTKVVDDETTESFPDAMPKIALIVKESFKPLSTWVDKVTGEEKHRDAKKNPVTDKYVCNQGRLIYRETYAIPTEIVDEQTGEVILNPEARDVLIASDNTSPITSESLVEEMSLELVD
jgi:hypothetical protein|tara:strand:+ start:381 stop:989 length:609 start_codon:yes stop_codon:yes gene_type:complete